MRTLKSLFGNIKINDDVLEKLGYERIGDSTWRSPGVPLIIRHDGKYYYNQENVYVEGQLDKRIEINTIEDLIALYVKLSAEDMLCELKWCNI